MNFLRAVVALLALTQFSACTGNKDVEKLFGGPEAVRVVRDAKVVEAFRLEDNLMMQDRSTATLADYAIANGPVPVDPASIEVLKDALLDPDTYVWDSAKGCLPNYGVRVRFVGPPADPAPRDVDVLFCFSCEMLLIHFDGAWTGGEDFDHSNDRLVGLVKHWFPHDEALKALR